MYIYIYVYTCICIERYTHTHFMIILHLNILYQQHTPRKEHSDCPYRIPAMGACRNGSMV